ncbi:Prefoldin beta-like protein [Ascodesmis nigricans]|uniref:Prefoldin beta-like protein n=1 Tax=Ascodesmis nigricans TaxID=341454 RepID=A0A4S2N2G4_9PEZI|nr:Prefoldin beta-like protein [Ascodesmis nigricans]
MAEDPQKLLQSLSNEFQKLEEELSDAIQARQKLESQLQENTAVQKEFSTLDEDANIYKMIGPVLVKQDKSEATMNVDKRLEFITAEIKRTETKIKDVGGKQEKKKIEIIQLQQRLQQAQSAA